jgi:hypothetical protein
MTLDELGAASDADFAITSAKHPILAELAVKLGREEAMLFWRLAWATGRSSGLSAAEKLWRDVA